jgi:hypothetical protein
MTTPDTVRRQLERVQNVALLAGAAGVVFSLIYIFAFNGWDQFCKSYLFAFI